MRKNAKDPPIPEQAKADPAAFEILRVWIAQGDQHVSLRTGVWDDPAAWGILLADITRHIAGAHADSMQWDPAAPVERIKAGFNAELASPTDEPTGRFED
jgi:hypothetical protein